MTQSNTRTIPSKPKRGDFGLIDEIVEKVRAIVVNSVKVGNKAGRILNY
jgi:hypothetical protein